MTLPNPLIAGFNPDPSVVRAGDDYYLVTSSFEYLPGLPVYHSTDMVTWTQVGNVATRQEQLRVEDVRTGGGAWAPTIRHRDGAFYVIVTVAMGRGAVLFTATDPAGPWSDGTPLEVDGIDPDLAWDDEGTAYVTYSALGLTPKNLGVHRGIEQVRVDLATGRALEEPRSLWSGTGLIFPEAPHLYRRGDWWYLVIAEGGTERGHGISVARSRTPDGPFTAGPGNPVVSARSTDRPVQCTGHGDVVQGLDGQWYVVMLGTRPRGMVRAFSALGRETFVSPARWTADGWLEIDPVALDPRDPSAWTETFDAGLGPQWISVRRLPASCSSVQDGSLVLPADGSTLNDATPVFVGLRQAHQTVTVIARMDATDGVGGLAVRYDEETHYEIEAGDGELVARATIPGFHQEWRQPLVGTAVELVLSSRRPESEGFGSPTCDLVGLGVRRADGAIELLAEVDGRSLTSETACSFTGRVVGVYATRGEVRVAEVTYEGDDT